MTIYLLYELSGEWEDYRKNIHSAYLDKSMCESAKNELEKENKEYIEQSIKCNQCLCGYGETNYCISCVKNEDKSECMSCQLEHIKNYCDKFDNVKVDTDKDGNKELYCEERVILYDDGFSYCIEEVEVIE